jgi:hypothetical protein
MICPKAVGPCIASSSIRCPASASATPSKVRWRRRAAPAGSLAPDSLPRSCCRSASVGMMSMNCNVVASAPGRQGDQRALRFQCRVPTQGGRGVAAPSIVETDIHARWAPTGSRRSRSIRVVRAVTSRSFGLLSAANPPRRRSILPTTSWCAQRPRRVIFAAARSRLNAAHTRAPGSNQLIHRALTGYRLKTRNLGPSLTGDIRSIVWWGP